MAAFVLLRATFFFSFFFFNVMDHEKYFSLAMARRRLSHGNCHLHISMSRLGLFVTRDGTERPWKINSFAFAKDVDIDRKFFFSI